MNTHEGSSKLFGGKNHFIKNYYGSSDNHVHDPLEIEAKLFSLYYVIMLRTL
jgi:hypothetical protein